MDSKIGLFMASLSNEAVENYASLQDFFMEGYEADKFPNEILLQLRNGEQKSFKIILAECTEQEGKLYYRETMFVTDYPPLPLRIILQFHDTPSAGHPGRNKTFDLVSKDYY
jgi:hypothetical protein